MISHSTHICPFHRVPTAQLAVATAFIVAVYIDGFVLSRAVRSFVQNLRTFAVSQRMLDPVLKYFPNSDPAIFV